MNKQKLIDALYTHISQRPGMDYGNYGDPTSYRAEYRNILKDFNHARQLLRFVEQSESITAEMILKASGSAWAGRLVWKEDKGRWTYCVGQYWPTEYRAAACGVLASVLWAWYRDQCGCETGDAIRAAARRTFGKSIQRKWFT